MRTLNDILREMTTWGTPACGLFCGVIGAVAALLMILLGFWNALLVMALAVVGVFLGAVKDKVQWLKNLLNKVIPSKDQE